MRTLLLVAALASLAVAAALLIAQRDYKRLLAYSSIEHMGLIALGTAVGGRVAVAAVLLHILGHGLAKAVAFCGAGQILQAVATSRIAAAGGLAVRSPALAVYFGLAVLALLGMPPFALFASELGIARAGFASDLGWAVAVGTVLIVVAFSAIARHTATMILGGSPSASDGPAPTTDPRGFAPLVTGLVATTVLGIWLGPFQTLLDSAAHVAGGR
jgi:hydrogenase-4 component F